MKSIFKTKNYKLFNLVTFNRKLNHSLVKNLVDSITKYGYFDGKPIIVDKDFNIIDGQHRFEACKEMKLPIYYTITNIDPQEAMIALNANQIAWKMIDYVRSWADSGVKCYKDLVAFDKAHSFGITNSVLIYFDSSSDKTGFQKIKDGQTFKINPHADDIVQFINACSGVPYYKSSYFIKATTRLFKIATPAQIEKIVKHIMSLPQQSTAAAYLAAFENIVNKGVQVKNRVSFNANS